MVDLDIKKVLEEVDLDFRKFILYIVAPLLLGGFAISLYSIVSFPDIFSGPALYLMAFFPFYMIILALTIPFFLLEKKKMEIDQYLHLFITRTGIIAKALSSRREIFNLLGQVEDYGALAKEINKVHYLVNKWNVSLSDACQIISTTTPSKTFGDFLVRLAYALETGATIEDFFENEQIVSMDTYELAYEATLETADILKELYISMVTAATFMITIVIILPLITGNIAISQMVLALIIFGIIEVSFFYLFSVTMLPERIWHKTGIVTERDTMLRGLFRMSLIATIILGVIVVLFTKLELMWMAAIISTPLIIPGYYELKSEKEIKRCDESFPAFIRAVGASSEATSIASTQALSRLRFHDVGPLTEHIRNLFKRLKSNINAMDSWLYFGAETGSDMIAKYTRMYVEGASIGAHPKKSSTLINDNVIRIVALRKRRYQSGSNMAGMLFGLMIAITFPIYIAYVMVDQIQKVFRNLTFPAGWEHITLLKAIAFDIGSLNIIIFVLILTHALFSSLITRQISAGNKLGALPYFSVLMWLGAIVSSIVHYIVSSILTTGG